jgi:hypothetical protein
MKLFGRYITLHVTRKHEHDWQLVEAEQCKICSAVRSHSHKWKLFGTDNSFRWGRWETYECSGCRAAKSELVFKNPDVLQDYGVVVDSHDDFGGAVDTTVDPTYRPLNDATRGDTIKVHSGELLWKPNERHNDVATTGGKRRTSKKAKSKSRRAGKSAIRHAIRT